MINSKVYIINKVTTHVIIIQKLFELFNKTLNFKNFKEKNLKPIFYINISKKFAIFFILLRYLKKSRYFSFYLGISKNIHHIFILYKYPKNFNMFIIMFILATP